MALERSKQYELIQKQLEGTSIRFYREAVSLLSTEGELFIHDVESVDPQTLETKYSDGLPGFVFCANMPYSLDGISTVVLQTRLMDGEEFPGDKPLELEKEAFYQENIPLYPNFSMHIVDGALPPEDILTQHDIHRSVLVFQVGGWGDKSLIKVYGKKIFEAGSFFQGVDWDTANEFSELVDLVERLNVDKNSYTKLNTLTAVVTRESQ